MTGPGEGGTAAPAGVVYSRADRLILGLLLLIVALAATLTPIRSYDYWWHLRTGALILQDHQIPRADPFSFTAPGTPWVDHEWLFQAAVYLGHRWLRPPVLVLLKALLACGIAALAARVLRREGHGPAGTAVFLTSALVGASFRLDVRPELATLLIVPICVDLVLRARRSGARAPLAGVVGLTALLANLHVGVVLVPAILALATVCTLAARLAGRQGDEDGHAGVSMVFERRLALTALGSVLAVGANPYGYRLYAVPFALKRLLDGLPWPNLEWVRPTFETFPFFFVMAGVGLLILIAGFRHADPVAAPAWLLAGVLAGLHARNIGLFFLLLPWGLARPSRALVAAIKRSRPFRYGTRGESIRPGFIVAAVMALGGLPLLLLLPPQCVLGIGLAPGNQPSAAVDFLERERIGERLYNDVRFGGYLIWRRYPGARVFVDGRNEIYGDLLRDIAGALSTADTWRRFLDQQGIDAAFLRYPPTLQKIVYPGRGGEPRTGERAFSAAFFPKEVWALVYWDDDAMIFVRRTPDHENVIRRLEYTALNPDDWKYAFAGVLIGRLPVGPILQELQRKLQEDPGCSRAQDLLGRFAAFLPAATGGPAAAPAGGRAAGR